MTIISKEYVLRLIQTSAKGDAALEHFVSRALGLDPAQIKDSTVDIEAARTFVQTLLPTWMVGIEGGRDRVSCRLTDAETGHFTLLEAATEPLALIGAAIAALSYRDLSRVA
jgi:hypothetical protein